MKKLFYAVIFAVAFLTVAPLAHAEEGDFSVDIAKYLTAHSRMLPQVMQQTEAPTRAVRPLPQPPPAIKHKLLRKVARIATAPITIPMGAPFVGYYYMRNKVLAHHLSFVSPDDSVKVGRFRWWPNPMRLGIYLANPGGAIHMPPNYSETLTSDLVLKGETWLAFDGPCRINQNGNNRITEPSGNNNTIVTSPFVHSSNQAGSNLGCTFFGYTGTAGAFDLGDSSGFLNNIKIAGINVNLANAGANATAFRMTNVEQSAFDDIGCIQGSVSGHACYRSIGTGAFFAGLNRIMSIDCEAPLLATNNQCIELGTISNDNTIIGGHANILGSGANNSTCILVSGATSGNNNVLGFDCDTGVTAVSVLSTVNGGLKGTVNVDSGVTNIANFGAGSFGNSIITNGNLPCTDNGVSGTNSCINYARNNFNTNIWQNQVGATFSFFYKDLLDSGNARITYVNGAGGDSRYDPGSGGSGLTRFCVAVACAGVSFESNGTRGVLVDGSGRYIATETTSSGAGAGKDVMEADSTAHRMQLSNNNGSFFPVTQTIGSSTVTTAGTAVTNGTCQAQTGITITGSLTTDQAVANINAALPATWQTGIRWSAEVSAAGTCTVNLCNPTAGSITPAATAVRCTVTR